MVISRNRKRFGRGARAALLAAGLLLAAAPASASLIRLFGEENAGTTSGMFLRIPVGARAVALGQAYSACATDGAALFWNPAGIMRTPGRQNFFASHSEYTTGIDLDYAAFHVRGQNFGYGLAMGVLRSGDISRTTEFHPDGTGQFFNANQFFLAASLARAMTDRFSIGGTIKYYQENLDQYQLKGALADLGILYFVGLGDMRVGFAVRNFGGDLKPGGTPPPLADGYVATREFQSYSAPTEGSFGVANTFEFSRSVNLLTTLDFNHPSDFKESFRLGGELGLGPILQLRSGYETSRDTGGFSSGFGVRLERKQFLVRLDYAYSDLGTFGGIHYLSVDLSPLARRKDPDAWRRRER